MYILTGFKALSLYIGLYRFIFEKSEYSRFSEYSLFSRPQIYIYIYILGISLSLSIYIYIYTHVCMYVCMYVCIYIYI